MGRATMAEARAAQAEAAEVATQKRLAEATARAKRAASAAASAEGEHQRLRQMLEADGKDPGPPPESRVSAADAGAASEGFASSLGGGFDSAELEAKEARVAELEAAAAGRAAELEQKDRRLQQLEALVAQLERAKVSAEAAAAPASGGSFSHLQLEQLEPPARAEGGERRSSLTHARAVPMVALAEVVEPPKKAKSQLSHRKSKSAGGDESSRRRGSTSKLKSPFLKSAASPRAGSPRGGAPPPMLGEQPKKLSMKDRMSMFESR